MLAAAVVRPSANAMRQNSSLVFTATFRRGFQSCLAMDTHWDQQNIAWLAQKSIAGAVPTA